MGGADEGGEGPRGGPDVGPKMLEKDDEDEEEEEDDEDDGDGSEISGAVPPDEDDGGEEPGGENRPLPPSGVVGGPPRYARHTDGKRGRGQVKALLFKNIVCQL